MKSILAVIILAASGSSLASENPLIGWWITVDEETPMMVSFGERRITWMSSANLHQGASSMPARYRGRGELWTVELFRESGVIARLMSVVLEEDGRLYFGAIGEFHVQFRRLGRGSDLLLALFGSAFINSLFPNQNDDVRQSIDTN